MDKGIEKIQKEKPIEELLNFCIINVDKPAGPTSFETANAIKKIFYAKKTGHFGTLDPLVTGVLPVAVNRACKLSEYFMHKDKTYIGKMQLHSDITEEKLEQEMKKFLGKIMQKPPVKSRVKRVLRERTINKFEILEKENRVVSFVAEVEAGTYIRKLIHDLGENIGGAHMSELRRVKAGIFDSGESKSVSDIEEAFRLWKEENNERGLREILIPAEIIKEILPFYTIRDENIKQILTGKPLTKEDFIDHPKKDDGIFAVFLKEIFIGIYKKAGSDESETSNIVARAEFVMN